MSKIQKSLTKLFQDHRIIFWYDEKGELQEEFENFSLQDVEKIKIDNNEFGIKYRAVHQPETKFLIYYDRPKPPDEENWLLDLNLANYEFSADRAALIAQELGLSWELKPFVEQHLDFFKSQKRTEQLQQLLEENDDQHQLALKMLALLTGADFDIEKILYELFVDLDEGKDEKYQNIVKFNLVTFFWKIIQHKYNYHSDNPTLKDFLVQLLINHFQTNLASPKRALNKEAAIFVNHWMDSARYHPYFDSLSDKIASELDIGKELESLDFRELLSVDTYKLIDSKIIFDLQQGIESGTLNFMGVQEIIRKRETKHWFAHYRHLYQALYFAAKLKDLHQSLRLTIETLEEGFRNYLEKFYQFDYAYRKYIYHASHAEHLDVLKSLTALVENIYVNSYLLKISDRWQQLVDQCQNWKIAGFPSQREFYQQFVKSFLKADKKIFVIIADGLRYESAVELTRQLLQEDGYQAELKVLVGQLPSYTKLGMAALLPNSKLSFNDRSANVFVDDLSSSSIEDRSKILQKHHQESVAIQAEDFLNMRREEGRQFTKQYKVIYIYHNEIDAVGDNPKSESQVFDAVEKEFELIKKLIRQIINFNGTNVLITADHGFLYQHSDIKESDFCKVEKLGEVFFSNHRCIVGKKLTEDSCVKKCTGN
ncbi:MAG: BREX-1 system phosphatase PglZ type A, partial [Candidatus Helarchaeota archaeon]